MTQRSCSRTNGGGRKRAPALSVARAEMDECTGAPRGAAAVSCGKPGSAGNHLVILKELCRPALCSSTKGWPPTGRPSISVPQWRPPIAMAPSLLFSELNKPISRFVSARDCRACDLRMSASSCPAKASSNSIAKRSPFFDNPRKAALSCGARANTASLDSHGTEFA